MEQTDPTDIGSQVIQVVDEVALWARHGVKPPRPPGWTPPPPEITGWRSMRDHIGLGNLAIWLDPVPFCGSAVVSETRLDGIQQIEVDFTEDISGSIVGLAQAEGLTGPVTIPADNQYTINGGMTLVIEFAGGLPNEMCYLIDLSGVIAGLIGDPDCLVRGLTGDVDNDEFVNPLDVAQTEIRVGQPVEPDNIRFDVNTDGGVITPIDPAIVGTMVGTMAACPCP